MFLQAKIVSVSISTNDGTMKYWTVKLTGIWSEHDVTAAATKG